MLRQKLQIKIIPVESHVPFVGGVIMTNCVVIWRKNVAVVVDPGGESEKIALFLKRRKLTVGAYWLTHAHPDHMGALPNLIDKFPAPIRYHKYDSWRRCLWRPCLSQSKPFGDIRRIACGDLQAKIIHSSGHTPGSVCYWFEDDGVLLSGDTLFRKDVGNTVGRSAANDLVNSLRKILRRVPDDTKVVPGHDGVTTIGAERDFIRNLINQTV